MKISLKMQERLQPSPLTAALSMTMAALALFAGAKDARAGDKIEFSIPGNQAIVQKPDWQIPDDYSAPVEFKRSNLSGHRYNVREQDAGETIIIPGSNDRHHGLHAWDGASRLSDLRNGDDPLDNPPEAQAKSNTLTNQFGSDSEWDLGGESSRFQSSSFTGQHNSGFSSGSSEFSSQGGAGFSQQHDGEEGSLSVPGMAAGNWHGDALIQTSSSGASTSRSASAAGVGLTAWGGEAAPSAISSLGDRYADAFQPAGSSSGGDNSLDISGPKGLLSATPTPGVGDSSIFGLTASDRSAPWINGDGSESPYRTKSQNFQRSVYRAYQGPAEGPVAPRLPRLPEGVISPYSGTQPPIALINQQFNSHPPILPLPKKPGSVFQ